VTLERRQFLRLSTGLVVGLYVEPRTIARAAPPPAAPAKLPPPNVFLRVGSDDTVTVLLAHSEMGQGVWTTLAMLVAEELGCDWAKIKVEHAPAAPAYAHTAMGMQMTGGSTSTWSEFDRYRNAGAVARELLLQAAAQRWSVPPASCRVQSGYVHSGNYKASFGSLADDANKLPPPAQVRLKDPREWKILGKPTKRLDSPEKVDGRAQYGMDVRLPGMLTALILRPPVFGARVKAFRPERARAVAGVKAVVQVPSGVAVVAEHFWAAKLGRDALEVDWDLGPHADLGTDKLREQMRAMMAQPGAKAASAGDVAAQLPNAKKTLEAEYELPYLAHATMEPMNCTARVSADKCEIWAGTQFQTMDQKSAAQITGLKPEQVSIHTQFLGGGFGRRATPNSDFVSEAVHLAKAMGAGVPVKVVWTREDDMRGGFYRPMWMHRLRVGLDKDGAPLAWRHTIVGQSIVEGTPFAMMIKDGVDATSVEGVADSPYVKAAPHYLVDLHSPKTGVPVLWWRSVGHSHTAFVMETMIDELAKAAGQDPVAYRRRLLKDHKRHLGVLNTVVAKAGWGTPLSAGRFRGIALHESFGSYVAQVAEVSIVGGRVRVHRVVCAVDCGICINPAGVEAQMQSAVAFGLSAALYGEITLKDGRVEQSNFHDYPILRLHEMPKVEVHIVLSTEKSGGIGEVGTPPIAPAVANAVFAATGKRQRRLPLRLG
jgi:isoquinoline 1-oxidoreductase beta subunit